MLKKGQIYSQTSADLDRQGVSKRSLQYRDGILVNGINTGTGVANTERISGEEYWTAMGNVGNYIFDQDNIIKRTFNREEEPGVEKFGLQSANIQLVGRNLFFLSKSDDIDPEMVETSFGTRGMSHNAMPTLRSLGIN